jgi:hypothetical protein
VALAAMAAHTARRRCGQRRRAGCRCYGSSTGEDKGKNDAHHAKMSQARKQAEEERRCGRSMQRPELEDGGGAPGAALREEGMGCPGMASIHG